MKVESDEIVHKFDVGGVVLGVDDAGGAAAAYATILANVQDALPDAKVQGVFVQKHGGRGRGSHPRRQARSRRSAPVVMFGLGGTVRRDLPRRGFRIAPIAAASTCAT